MNKTKEVFEKIIDNLQTIVNNGEYEKFLKFQKNFRNYSFNNLILIYSQFPEATRVAGKATWKKLKRELNENAKKIWILAPIPKSYTRKIKKVEDGKEIEKTEVVHYNWYKYVYVFDISQTEGKAIPLQSRNIDSNDMAYFYDKLKNFSNYSVVEKELTKGVKGFYHTKKRYIAIEKSLSLNDKAAVLLHELSHALFDDFDYSKDRDLSEIFVESIAFIVADHFGLDTSLCSFNYILKWAKGEPKKVIELGNKIQKCSNKFIKDIEEFEMQELQLAA